MVLSDDTLDLLTAYALDALAPEDVARIEALLAEQPELRQHLAELRATVNTLPYALPESQTDSALRQRILDYATGRASRQARAASGRPAWLNRLSIGFGTLTAAALLAAVFAWTSLQGVQTELAFVRSELATAQANQQYIARVVTQPQVVAQLSGANGRGSILFEASGNAFLAAQLAPLPEDQVYQLWLIDSGAPVSGGIFRVDQEGYGFLALPAGTVLSDATIFAVTREPAPGSAGPTTPILIQS